MRFLSVDGGGSVFGGGLGGVFGFFGVVGDTFVFHISDESVLVVSGVGNGLDTTVGEVDAVGALEVTVVVLGLGFLEVGTRVVIGNTVLVSEGLGRELLLLVGVRGGFVGGSGLVSGGGFVGWGRGIGPGGGNSEESGNDGGLQK